MKFGISRLYIWKAEGISFKKPDSRKQLANFMEDDDIYLKVMIDFGDVIDLNLVTDNKKFALDVYNSMSSEIKNKFQAFLTKKVL